MPKKPSNEGSAGSSPLKSDRGDKESGDSVRSEDRLVDSVTVPVLRHLNWVLNLVAAALILLAYMGLIRGAGGWALLSVAALSAVVIAACVYWLEARYQQRS